ncbi:MAG: type II toxin-antitoxin system CcdA family antitoxin [Candidatus Dormiibacterota bacterium]
MRIPRVNIYLSDELMAAVRPLELNLSQVMQVALRQRLDRQRVDEWLDQLNFPTPTATCHREVQLALEPSSASE